MRRRPLAAVEAAIDRGINFIDCANTYGPADVRILWDPDSPNGFCNFKAWQTARALWVADKKRA